MNSQHPRSQRSDAGYAMVTVVIFALVITIAGIAFFGMAGHETQGALYRQSSSEAFFLADGAVERARAKFLEDRTWRDGFTNEAAGRGTYDAVLTDTTFAGEPDVVQIVATGRVEQAVRRVEVMAKVPPTGFGVGILVSGDADVDGNMCLSGDIHVNGGADFGPNDVHLTCGGEQTSGFEITPPPIYTEPDRYPDATYYYVRGMQDGSGNYYAKIFDRYGVDITASLPDSLHDGITTYNAGSKTFHFNFDSATELDFYFHEDTGLFAKAPGDQSVVVNFGEGAVLDPPGMDSKSAITLDGNASSLIHTTIINSRFTGATFDQRFDPAFWTGGMTTLKQIQIEPYQGIALVVADFQKVGGSNTIIGSEDWPGFLYVTNDVEGVNANFILHGALMTLGDWSSSGGPDVTFDDGFLQNFPDWLVEEWNSGVSGTMRILRWRELASY